MSHEPFPDTVVGDTLSAFAVVGSLMGWLPDIAALAAIIWYSIQIYDRVIMKRKKMR